MDFVVVVVIQLLIIKPRKPKININVIFFLAVSKLIGIDSKNDDYNNNDNVDDVCFFPPKSIIDH